MKQYLRWVAAAAVCLCLMAAGCKKTPKEPENPLSGARWYTATESWTFFADGTFEKRNQISNKVEAEGTYAFAADGSGKLQYEEKNASIFFNDARTEIQLAYRSGETDVLLKSNPYRRQPSNAETMEQLWIGDYESLHAIVYISYCVQDKSVTYAIKGETDKGITEVISGVWKAKEAGDRTVSDERFTVTLTGGPSIDIAINPGYEDSAVAKYAGNYLKFR